MKNLSKVLALSAACSVLIASQPLPQASVGAVAVNNNDLKAKKADFWNEGKLFSMLSNMFDFAGEQMPKDTVDVEQKTPGVFVAKGQVASQEFRLTPGSVAERLAAEVDLKGVVLKVANFKLQKSPTGSVLANSSTVYLPKETKFYHELTAIYARRVTDVNRLVETHREYLAWENDEANNDTMLTRLAKCEADLKYLRENLQEDSPLVPHTKIDAALAIIDVLQECFTLKQKKNLLGEQKEPAKQENYLLNGAAHDAKRQLAAKIADLTSALNRGQGVSAQPAVIAAQ
jgi:hypothetical protein